MEGLSMDAALMKRPSAFIPVGMSAIALAIVLGYAGMFGIAGQADEGTAAHTWQLLMACQLPVIAFFAIKWVPKHPKQGLSVLGLQLASAVAAMFPVWCFRW